MSTGDYKGTCEAGFAKGNGVVPDKESLLLNGVIELASAARALLSRARMGAFVGCLGIGLTLLLPL
jgi:hypothetical protein